MYSTRGICLINGENFDMKLSYSRIMMFGYMFYYKLKKIKLPYY